MDLEQNPFRLKQWVVYPTQDRIENDDGESISIEPRMMAVLICLARHRGETVSNETLIREVWSENFVGENPLYRSFSVLRRDLGDDQKNPVFIKTYPRKGYRLICPVEPVEPSEDSAPQARHDHVAPSAAGKPGLAWPRVGIAVAAISVLVGLAYWFNTNAVEQPETSIGVLGFDDLGDQPDATFLGDGLAEDVLTMLNRIPQLEMAPRDASFYFKGKDASLATIADALDVNYLLSGSVEKAGDRVTVDAKLVEAKTDAIKWSGSFERDYTQIHSVQSDIALELTRELGIELSAESRAQLRQSVTENNDAYIFYWRGVDYLRRPNDDSNLKFAVSMFERSLKFDVRYPQAYAGLCEAKLWLYAVNKLIADFEDAERNCHRALTLDRENLGAKLALGVLYRESGQFSEAVKVFDAVLETHPNDIEAIMELGRTYAANSKPHDAQRHLRRAVALQPGYWATHSTLADFLFRSKDYVGAARHYRMVTDLTPDSARSFSNLASAQYMLDDFANSALNWQRSIEISPTKMALSNTGLSYYYLGRFEDAEAMQLRALELAPDDHNVWGRLAESRRFIDGKASEATLAYQRAVELAGKRMTLNPNDWNTAALLGLYSAHMVEEEAANDYIALAHQLSPDNPDIAYYEALMRQALGDMDGVRKSLERAIALGFPARLIKHDPDLKQLANDPSIGPLIAAEPAS